MDQEQASAAEIRRVLDRERPRRRWWLVAVVALIAVVTVLLLLPRDNGGAALQFVTADVKRGDLTIQVTATGTLEPLNQVDVGSEISGTIEEVRVDFNDHVNRGQVMARINTDEQQARVVQARAALEVAAARVLQAEATVLETDLKLKRCQTLAEKGLCTPQDLDAARAAHARADADEASARAQVSQAQATLDAEQSRLAKAEIRSPVDGIVLKRQIEPGQTVAASLQAPILFTLAENLAQMELKVAVDEADIGKVREGQQATFTVDAYGDRSFPAVITQVRLAPLTEGGVVSYETILSLSNDELLLRPGMTATAHITVAQISDALMVPNAALRFVPPSPQQAEEQGFMDQLFPRWGRRSRPAGTVAGGARRVWVLRDGQPVAVEVGTGPSDGHMTQVTAGRLQEGMRVITDARNAAR